ncbi:MAG: TolC family protein [Candidatus Portiera sp.]|nr:TolC family protein [Portiera sp.]
MKTLTRNTINHIFKALLALIVTLMAPLNVAAAENILQESVVADPKNALQELVVAAQKNDDQLLIAKAQFEALRGQAGEGIAPILPQLRLNVQSSQIDNSCTGCTANTAQPDSSGTSTRIEFTQTLYDPVKYRTFSATKARVEQFGYQYGMAQNSLFTRLLDQYLNILTEADKLRTIGAQRDRLSKQLKIVSTMARSGTRSRVDVAEIAANLALSQSQYEFSRITLRSFYEGLSASIKLDIKNLPPIRRDLELEELESYNTDYWTGVALEKNLGFLARKAEVKAAVEDVKISNRGHVPTFDLFATYVDRGATIDSRSVQTSQTEVGVRFNVPIYTGGRVFASIRTAKARLDEAERRLNLVRIELVTIVPSLVRQIKQGEELIKASKSALDARASIVEQTELRYRAGADDITDLLLAYERLYESERSYYTSLYSHIRNYANFYVRVGGLNEDVVARFYEIGELENYDPTKPVY